VAGGAGEIVAALLANAAPEIAHRGVHELLTVHCGEIDRVQL
jgi:hypothetical protein